jgi:hypothetical protein
MRGSRALILLALHAGATPCNPRGPRACPFYGIRKGHVCGPIALHGRTVQSGRYCPCVGKFKSKQASKKNGVPLKTHASSTQLIVDSCCSVRAFAGGPEQVNSHQHALSPKETC